MSTKQPRCLNMMGYLPTPASKAYLVTFELIQVLIKTHVQKIFQKWNPLCLLQLFERFTGWNG